jgi:hypothetical protein
LSYLNKWYQKDDNAIPARYQLQPKLTPEDQDWAYWAEVENTLRTAFGIVVNGALKNTLTQDQKFKYLKSATEQEIIEGLFNNHTIAKENIYFYNRKFENIDTLTPKEFATLDDVKHFSDFRGNIENQLDTEIPIAQTNPGRSNGSLSAAVC